jgi:hypothetical protein
MTKTMARISAPLGTKTNMVLLMLAALFAIALFATADATTDCWTDSGGRTYCSSDDGDSGDDTGSSTCSTDSSGRTTCW